MKKLQQITVTISRVATDALDTEDVGADQREAVGEHLAEALTTLLGSDLKTGCECVEVIVSEPVDL